MIPLKVYNYIAKGDFVTYVGFTYMGSRWLLMLDLKIFVWINVTKKQMNRTGNITPSLANVVETLNGYMDNRELFNEEYVRFIDRMEAILGFAVQ